MQHTKRRQWHELDASVVTNFECLYLYLSLSHTYIHLDSRAHMNNLMPQV